LTPPEVPMIAGPLENQDSPVISLGGELIGAVARGVNAAGADFDSLFHGVRVELADDYGFLDPMANTLVYAAGVVSVKTDIPENVFVSGLSEALRRVVARVAVGDRTRRVRERIALELLGVARKRKAAWENSGFRNQLDRIAGTKVI